MTTLSTLRTLWGLKRRYSLTWSEALFEGIQGLREYEAIDRRFEQQREARRMVARSIGPGAQGAAEDVSLSTHHSYK